MATKELLTKKEHEICQNISVLKASLNSKRAKALLSLNNGDILAKAAENSGLTIGQLKYLVRVFNQKRLAIFPDDMTSNKQAPEKKTKTLKDAKGKKAKKEKGKKKDKKKDKKKKKEKKKGKTKNRNKKSKKK